jgi:hypothetical protein
MTLGYVANPDPPASVVPMIPVAVATENLGCVSIPGDFPRWDITYTVTLTGGQDWSFPGPSDGATGTYTDRIGAPPIGPITYNAADITIGLARIDSPWSPEVRLPSELVLQFHCTL